MFYNFRIVNESSQRPATSEGQFAGAPSGPVGPQIFQPTGGAFKSMPSPKVTAHPTPFDFSKSSSTKDSKEDGKPWPSSVPSSPVTKEASTSVGVDAKPPSTPPHSSSGTYPSMPYFGQYENMLQHQSFYRTGQAPNVPLPLPISIGYAPTLVLPTTLSSGSSFSSSMHNKHSIHPGYYPAPTLVVRPAQHDATFVSSASSSLPQSAGHVTSIWSGATKPSVIVTKSSAQVILSTSGSTSSNASTGLPSGSISNGTPIRPPSRETVPTSQAQCFAGVMNMKSGTLCGTLAPVTLGDLSRPSRVKAITATIPVASDLDSSGLPVPSPNTSSSNTNNSSGSSVSRQSSAPSTPSTPGMSSQHQTAALNDPPGLMPPPDQPKFVLAPTPAQLGRAPFQRRQSTAQPASPSDSSTHSGGEEDQLSPNDPCPTTSFAPPSTSSVATFSPNASTATVSGGSFATPTSTTAPSTPNIPPSPSQNGAQQQSSSNLQSRKSMFKRSKDDGMDK